MWLSEIEIFNFLLPSLSERAASFRQNAFFTSILQEKEINEKNAFKIDSLNKVCKLTDYIKS